MLKIGPHTIAPSLVLAPMAGVTDRPFRQLCRRLGAGLVVSEMVTADTQLWQHRKTQSRLNHRGETGPISVQIVGTEPAQLAEAARCNVDRGADIIDINMGCPAKKVCRKAAGSALLRDEPLVGRLLEAVVKAVTVPVTLKIRTGWAPDERNGVRIAQIAQASGIQALAVHGRTRACRCGPSVEYDTIRNIVRNVHIPVLANGDITDGPSARRVLAHTGAAGLMIGRAAQGNPWIFQQIQHNLQTGQPAPEPSAAAREAVLLEHLEGLYELYGESAGVRIARKHVGWYLQTRTDGASWRQQFNTLTDATSQKRLVRAFCAQPTRRVEYAA